MSILLLRAVKTTRPSSVRRVASCNGNYKHAGHSSKISVI